MNVKSLLASLRTQGKTLGAVESCTGGLLSAAFTAIPGSSDVFMGGLITYSNALKTKLSGVPAELIEAHGAVSEQVAISMAQGGRKALGVDICISITGIAGPGGATADKPVGRVHIAVAYARNEVMQQQFDFGTQPREEIRRLSVEAAIAFLSLAISP